MKSAKHKKVSIENILDFYGGQTRMAKSLSQSGVSLSRQAIGFWTEVPAHWVLTVEEQTGFSRYQIRPDIYGDRHISEIPAKKPMTKLEIQRISKSARLAVKRKVA